MDPKFEIPTTDKIRSLRASLANINKDERDQIQKLFKCKEPFAKQFQEWQNTDDFTAFAHPDRIVTMNALCELGGFPKRFKSHDLLEPGTAIIAQHPDTLLNPIFTPEKRPYPSYSELFKKQWT